MKQEKLILFGNGSHYSIAVFNNLLERGIVPVAVVVPEYAPVTISRPPGLKVDAQVAANQIIEIARHLSIPVIYAPRALSSSLAEKIITIQSRIPARGLLAIFVATRNSRRCRQGGTQPASVAVTRISWCGTGFRTTKLQGNQARCDSTSVKSGVRLWGNCCTSWFPTGKWFRRTRTNRGSGRIARSRPDG